MKYQNVDLYGIAEARTVDYHDGLLLQRVPEMVRVGLEEKTKKRILQIGGAEIRFVLKGGSVCITLSCADGEATAYTFFGPFDAKLPVARIGKAPVIIEVAIPEIAARALSTLTESMVYSLPFQPRVCRLVLFGGQVHLHGIEGEIRAPLPREVPDRAIIAYGTSITHGSVASAFHLTYIAQTAWHLRSNLINLGTGGSCFAEPAIADYIAARDDWDIAVLELSINMLAQGFSDEEFERRVKYFISQITAHHPTKPVFCISILPFWGDWCDVSVLLPNAVCTADCYRAVLEKVVAEVGAPNLHYVPGEDLLTDIRGLSRDLLHPADNAMIEVGRKLASRIDSIVCKRPI